MFGKKKAIKSSLSGPFENSQYWTSGDYTLHYRVDKAEGKEKGKFFILHGFWMNTMFYDELVAALNGKGYTAYRVDLPSFGYSTHETKETDYVKPAELIGQMITDLDDGKGFVLYGHSMGGSVAMEVAASGNKSVKALILNAPMLMHNSNDRQAEMFTQPYMVKLLTLEAAIIRRLRLAINAFIFLMTWDGVYAKSFDPKRFTAPFADPKAGESLGFFTGHVQKPNMKQTKKIKVPVQYVAGGRDLFVGKVGGKKIRKALPKKTDYRVIKGAGHCFPQNKTELAVQYALELLEK